MLSVLYEWVVTKADGPPLRRFALRCSLLVLLLLVLTAQFPAAMDVAKLPFGYVELRHHVSVLDAGAGLAVVSVTNTGTSKADALRIQVAAGSGVVRLDEVHTPEQVQKIAAQKGFVLELKRLAPQTKISATVKVVPASRIVDLKVLSAADQGASMDASTPTWVERVHSVASFLRAELVDGASNLVDKVHLAAENQDRLSRKREGYRELPLLRRADSAEPHLAMPPVAMDEFSDKTFSQVIASKEFRSTLFAGCVATLLVQWLLGGGVAYLLVCALLPLTIFGYFTNVPFIPGPNTAWLTAGCCVIPAAALASERRDARPLGAGDWDAAVGWAAFWGLLAWGMTLRLVNAPLTVVATPVLILILLIDLRSPPYLKDPSSQDLGRRERHWLVARSVAVGLLVLGPILWQASDEARGNDVAWLVLVLLTTPLAYLLRSRAVKTVNEEINAGNSLRFPPIGAPVGSTGRAQRAGTEEKERREGASKMNHFGS